MSAKNSKHRDPSAPRGVAHDWRARKWRRWSLVLILAALAIAAMLFLRPKPSPALPVVDTAGFEPMVADQIKAALSPVRAQPSSGAAWGRLGLVLQAHELSEEALVCFAHAERFAPREPQWPYFHGLLLASKSPDRSIARLSRAADLAGIQMPSVRLRFAQVLFEMGRFSEAEAQFKKLEQMQTYQPPVLLGFGEVLHSQGRLEEARRILQPCLKTPFTGKRAQTLIASIERQLGNTNAAHASVKVAAELPPDRHWPDPLADEAAQYRIGRKAWTDSGQQLLEQNRLEDAALVVAQLTRNYPDAPEGWLLLGRLRFVQHDCAGAGQALRRHLQLASNSVNGHFQLGIALLCLEKYPESAETLEKAIELKPDFGEAHFNLGFALARSGRGADAIAALRKAIRYNPDFADSYIILADLLIQTGERLEARRLLTRAVQLNPADDRAKLLLERMAR